MLPAVVVLVGVALVIALWKPWESRPAGAPSRSPVPSVAAGESAVPSGLAGGRPARPTTDPRAVACTAGSGWRVVTLERSEGRESRSWMAIEPAPASGPGDTAIPVRDVVTERLLGLGYCPPEADERALAGNLSVTVFRLSGRGRPPVVLRRIQPLSRPSPGNATLYAPPAGGRAANAWAPGRYVFRLRDSRDGSRRWFGVEVTRPTRPRG